MKHAFAAALRQQNDDVSLIQIIDKGQQALAKRGVQVHAKAWYTVNTHHEATGELELHASRMADQPGCARYHILDHFFPEDWTEKPSKTWFYVDHGTVIHAWIEALSAEIGLAEIFDTESHEPTELKIGVPDLMASSKTDITTIILQNGYRYMVDVKSANPDEIGRRKRENRPKEKHRTQLNTYLLLYNMMHQAGHPVAQRLGPISRGVILYYDKSDRYQDPITGLPMIEFVVNYSEPAANMIFHTASAAVQSWKTRTPESELPPKVCASPNVPQARACRLCTECFAHRLYGELEKTDG